ncbi:head-tail connector protein [Devosia sp. Leaf64]|uniref:head-tail connector protein n=1 Tax=Devosia sp. Leaf64 TaxID=1736229 RepID=UPI0009EA9916|nr:head-tail connector protein [Devosia sp. Leaf64]
MTALTDLKQHLELLDDTEDSQLSRIIVVALATLANDIGAETTAEYENLPAPLQHAVLMKATHLFWNRNPVLVDHSMVRLAMGYDDLIAPYVRQVC